MGQSGSAISRVGHNESWTICVACTDYLIDGKYSSMIFSFSKNFYFSTRFYRRDNLPVDY
jgi:hypothetical protein